MKPTSVEVYPVYICPECNDRHCESMEYVRKVSRILCGCGHLLNLFPIKTFNISPVYQDSLQTVKKQQAPIPEPPKLYPQKPPINQLNVNSFDEVDELLSEKNENKSDFDKDEMENAVDFLVSLGWKKREANKKVQELAPKFELEKNKKISKENAEDFANFLLFNH